MLIAPKGLCWMFSSFTKPLRQTKKKIEIESQHIQTKNNSQLGVRLPECICFRIFSQWCGKRLSRNGMKEAAVQKRKHVTHKPLRTRVKQICKPSNPFMRKETPQVKGKDGRKPVRIEKTDKNSPLKTWCSTGGDWRKAKINCWSYK